MLDLRFKCKLEPANLLQDAAAGDFVTASEFEAFRAEVVEGLSSVHKAIVDKDSK